MKQKEKWQSSRRARLRSMDEGINNGKEIERRRVKRNVEKRVCDG